MAKKTITQFGIELHNVSQDERIESYFDFFENLDEAIKGARNELKQYYSNETDLIEANIFMEEITDDGYTVGECDSVYTISNLDKEQTRKIRLLRYASGEVHEYLK